MLDALFDAYPVLAVLPEPLQAEVRAQLSPLHAAEGQILFRNGSRCPAFLFINRGVIRVEVPVGEDRTLLLYHLSRGQACILTTGCLMAGSRYQARGVVANELAAMTLPRALFLRLVGEVPAFRHFVFAFFNERLTELLNLIDAVGFHQLDERLAALLLARGPLLEITHQVLADELGTVREVVSRLLKEFEKEGWVRLGRAQIEVRDPQALADLVPR